MKLIINAESEFAPEVKHQLNSQGDPLLNLLLCLGYDTLNPPLAALLSQYHQLEGDWVVLSPVYWQATHNNALITAFGKSLNLDETGIKDSFHRFAEYLRAEGLGLYYHDASTWLLSASQRPRLKTKPVHYLLDRPLMMEIAAMDETFYWQKFLTESQMFFATQAHHETLNGVWLWGSAPLDSKKSIKICADEHFISLAQLCASHVSLYQPSLSLNDFDLLLVADFSLFSEVHQEQLKKRSARWYWNNIGYDVPHLNCFTRLWRTLIHAH